MFFQKHAIVFRVLFLVDIRLLALKDRLIFGTFRKSRVFGTEGRILVEKFSDRYLVRGAGVFGDSLYYDERN